MTSARDLSPYDLASLLGVHPPTAEQAAIVSAPLTATLVDAGAGSGKTETMAARVVWLVSTGRVAPEHVLGLTFTRKASAELAQRIRTRLTQARTALQRAKLAEPAHLRALYDGEPTVLTYHSYASRLLTEHAARGGFEPGSRLAGEAVCWQLATEVVEGWSGPLENLGMAPATVTATVLQLAGDFGEHLTNAASTEAFTRRLLAHAAGLPRDAGRSSVPGTPYAEVGRFLERQQTRLVLLPLVAAYVAAKRERDLLDHGDQVALAALVVRDHPEVARTERERFRVTMLDEYQDTSQAQDVLLRSLFGDGHAVTAVGDPVQAIYGWRGASAGAMSRFARDYRGTDATAPERLHLSTSFRNGSDILRVANTVGRQLRAGGPELRSGVPQAGTVRCALLPTAQDEAEWIAERSAELVADGVGPQNIAVLARKKSVLRRILRALTAAGVPAEVSVLSGLLEVPEIVDVTAVLRLLAEPEANDAVIRLLTGARWRFGPRDLAALGARARELAANSDAAVKRDSQRAGSASAEASADMLDAARRATLLRGPSLVEALDDPGTRRSYSPAAWERLGRLRRELARLRQHSQESLPDLVDRVVRTVGLDLEVMTSSHGEGDAGAARGHLDRFAAVAAEYERTSEQSSLRAFLRYLNAATERESGLSPATMSAGRDAVQLATVHSAKGLEWDAVFVAGLTRGVFPDTQGSSTWLSDVGTIPVDLRGDSQDLPTWEGHLAQDQRDLRDRHTAHREAWRAHDLREEHRLAYVAVTRARNWLGCSGAWFTDGAKGLRGPSEILRTVRAECALGAGTVDEWCEEPGYDNPLLTDPDQAPWPYDPLGSRRADVGHAAALVRERIVASASASDSESRPVDGDPWAEDVELVLRSLAQHREAASQPLDVPLPTRLTVSDLVALRRDPQRFAQSVRRPVPQPPSSSSTLGSAFHAWLEQRFRSAGPLDIEDPRAFADASGADDSRLTELQDAFSASQWAERTPLAVEVAFDTHIADQPVRGRIDAVFADADRGFVVVDWKTGARPTGEDAAASSVQLDVYRHAWAEVAGVAVEQVRAAFHYVRSDETCYPPTRPASELVSLLSSLPAGG